VALGLNLECRLFIPQPLVPVEQALLPPPHCRVASKSIFSIEAICSFLCNPIIDRLNQKALQVPIVLDSIQIRAWFKSG
jgi:predicted nucleic acid-binding Zn ribbon protein